MKNNNLRAYHAPVWDEPVIAEMGSEGRRGIVFRPASHDIIDRVGSVDKLIPEHMIRNDQPALPEMSEQEVQRHSRPRPIQIES